MDETDVEKEAVKDETEEEGVIEEEDKVEEEDKGGEEDAEKPSSSPISSSEPEETVSDMEAGKVPSKGEIEKWLHDAIFKLKSLPSPPNPTISTVLVLLDKLRGALSQLDVSPKIDIPGSPKNSKRRRPSSASFSSINNLAPIEPILQPHNESHRHTINRMLVKAWRLRALKAEEEVERVAALMEEKAGGESHKDSDMQALRNDLLDAQEQVAAISRRADERIKDLRSKAENAISQLSSEIEILSQELLQNKKHSEAVENESRKNAEENGTLKAELHEHMLRNEQAAHREAAIQLRMEAMSHKAHELEALLQYNNRSEEYEKRLEASERDRWEAKMAFEKLRAELEWRLTQEADYRMQITNLQGDIEEMREKRWRAEKRSVQLEQLAETTSMKVRTQSREIEALKQRLSTVLRAVQTSGVRIPPNVLQDLTKDSSNTFMPPGTLFLEDAPAKRSPPKTKKPVHHPPRQRHASKLVSPRKISVLKQNALKNGKPGKKVR